MMDQLQFQATGRDGKCPRLRITSNCKQGKRFHAGGMRGVQNLQDVRIGSVGISLDVERLVGTAGKATSDDFREVGCLGAADSKIQLI